MAPVGIELRPASCRWRVTGLALSICETGYIHATFVNSPAVAGTDPQLVGSRERRLPFHCFSPAAVQWSLLS